MRQALAPHASTGQGPASSTSPCKPQSQAVQFLMAVWVMLTAPFRALARLMADSKRFHAQNWRTDTDGFVNTNKLLFGLAAIVVAIFGPIIGAQLLATLLPDYFASLTQIFDAFNGADVNSTLGNTILHSMAILVLLAGIFAPIGLAIGIFAIKRYGGRSS